MRSYDYIVVGSGVAGLTVSRILALFGNRVLLLEKASYLGGSAKRFRLGGVPFDVGFHFTGGFSSDGTGVLDEMLKLLGVRERIKPIYYPRDACHEIVFPTQNVRYVVPCGVEILRDQLKRDFPTGAVGIDRYFRRFCKVVADTPTLRVAGFDQMPPILDEDGISLQSVLDECIPDPLVQAILSGFCMCYGTRPDEVSFATHSRISSGLHESLARVQDGGQALVDALTEGLRNSGVEIQTATAISACTDIKDRKATRFVLTDGSEVTAKACVFTIHPQQILQTLPQEHLHKAFRDRAAEFEPSVAFFTLFGQLDGLPQDHIAPITSIFPGLDINAMLTCRTPIPVDGPLVVLRSVEQTAAGAVETVSALEVAFAQWTEQWANSSVGKRPAQYYQYKRDRVDSIVRRIGTSMPECAGRMRVMDSASTLTFRDYLNSPDGAAYGIKQTLGQFNVSGRLPITNVYAAGQCALLPGIIGAMTSAFLVSRSLLGRDAFTTFLSSIRCR